MRETVGALSYPCPVCRVGVGRACRNRRGYHVKTHPDRVRRWLADEYADERDRASHHRNSPSSEPGVAGVC